MGQGHGLGHGKLVSRKAWNQPLSSNDKEAPSDSKTKKNQLRTRKIGVLRRRLNLYFVIFHSGAARNN